LLARRPLCGRELAGLSLASPIAVPATSVERVLRSLAGEHRPSVAPPVLLSVAHIKVRRKSPTPAIHTLRLLNALRLHLSTVVIDHDEMQPDSLKQLCELAHSRKPRSVFCVGHDRVGHAGTRVRVGSGQLSHALPERIDLQEIRSPVKHCAPSKSAWLCRAPWELPNSRLWTDTASLFRPLCSVAIARQS
jgi:hypothetical protein